MKWRKTGGLKMNEISVLNFTDPLPLLARTPTTAKGKPCFLLKMNGL
jgi:hypothetical protein